MWDRTYQWFENCMLKLPDDILTFLLPLFSGCFIVCGILVYHDMRYYILSALTFRAKFLSAGHCIDEVVVLDSPTNISTHAQSLNLHTAIFQSKGAAASNLELPLAESQDEFHGCGVKPPHSPTDASDSSNTSDLKEMAPTDENLTEIWAENEVLKATTQNLQSELVKAKVALQKERKERSELAQQKSTPDTDEKLLKQLVGSVNRMSAGENTTFLVERNGQTHRIDMTHDDMVSVVQQGLESSGFTKVTAEGYENRLPVSIMPRLQEIKGFSLSPPATVRLRGIENAPVQSSSDSGPVKAQVGDSKSSSSIFKLFSPLRPTARSFYPDPANKFLNADTGTEQPPKRYNSPSQRSNSTPRRTVSPPPEDLVATVIKKHREKHANTDIQQPSTPTTRTSTPTDGFNFNFLDGDGGLESTSPKTLKIMRQFGIEAKSSMIPTDSEIQAETQGDESDGPAPKTNCTPESSNVGVQSLIEYDETSGVTIIPNSRSAAVKVSNMLAEKPELVNSITEKGSSRTIFVAEVSDYSPKWVLTDDNPLFTPAQFRAAKTHMNFQAGAADTRNFFKYGLRYTAKGSNAYRTVMIMDIPPTATKASVLSVVRGGALELLTLVDSPAPNDHSLTARIVFLWEASAFNFMNHVRDVKRVSPHGRFQLAGSPVHVVHVTTPTYPTPFDLLRKAFSGQVSRMLMLEGKGGPWIDKARTMLTGKAVSIIEGSADDDNGVKGKGKEKEKEKEQGRLRNNLLIEFSGIRDAVIAADVLQRDAAFKGVVLEYGRDPCDWV